MKISSKNYIYNNQNYVRFGQSKPQTKLIKPIKPKHILKGTALGLMTLTMATCSNIRGGNFIYNNKTNSIEHLSEFKAECGLNLDINDTECHTNQFGVYGCYDKENINKIGIDKWIDQNKEKLDGACVFDRQDDSLSYLIGIFTIGNDCDNKFVPAHAAPIYKDDDGEFKLLQIEAPKVYTIPLKEYLKNDKKQSLIFLRDFEIDKERYRENVKKNIGKPYGYISAGQSVSSLINIDGGLHCSEGYVLEMQKEGLFKGVDANNITPHTLMHLLANNHYNDTTTF
jgi:hypothetical protein